MVFDIPQFENPLILLLISPVILAAWLAVRKGISKPLMLSRVIILSLLIIALAGPYTLTMTTERDDAPKITVISDQTMSMDLFDMNKGQELFESLKSRTPTTFRKFAGISSPIGNEVLSNAEGNNNIVLVSDGYSNYGKDLFDAISLVSRDGTRVYAVNQKPLHNDASVEIESPKNLIVGNENVFNIIVRQAGSETSYQLDLNIDGTPVKRESFTQTERTKTIPFSYAFNKLGSHEITAQITPSSEDRFKLNNIFYKSVFVVPKPKVLAITSDTSSPLYTIMRSLYGTSSAGSLPDNLLPYKAVIIDNKGAGELSADNLRTYVGNGGGLVVVGGDAAYDKGSYNNSPVEALLPIISRAGEFKGGRNVVIVLDSSGSTSISVLTDFDVGEKYAGKERTVIGEIDALAISIVRNIGRDSNLGLIAFGGKIEQKELESMSSNANRNDLEAYISNIGPKGDNPTDLDLGFQAANEMLNKVSGTKEVIVISDGVLPPEGYDQTLKSALELQKNGVKINLVQMIGQIPPPSSVVRTPEPLYGKLADALGVKVNVFYVTERPNLISETTGATPTPTPEPTPEITNEYPLIAAKPDHFITQGVNITASVTGFNDVIPKMGGEALVTTNRGKPIITTWGFGLGRVVSFTTDNGDGITMWAPQVYSREKGDDNPRLISSMINWAIGDPRPKEGVVVQAPDMWAGTGGRIVVTSDTLPQVKLDGAPLDLSRTGPTAYEATINPEKEGFHDLSGYEIAVNYPLEYREIGFNEKLNSVIESNGGRVYGEDEVLGLLLIDIKEKATRTVQKPKSEKELFLLAALVLFLAEVIIRRMKDYRKERQVIEENPPRTMTEVAE